MEATPISLISEALSSDQADRETFDEEDWLMATSTGDRIEQKIDRLTAALNELHRELGAILARDAEQEKAVARFMESTASGRQGLDSEIDKLEAKHDGEITKLETKLDALQREYDTSTGATGAKVAILMRVAAALGLSTFGLLVHLFSKLLAGG